MKQVVPLFCLFLAILSGCTVTGEKVNVKTLSVSTTELVFSHSGGEAVVDVTTNDDGWTCGSYYTWITCSRDGDRILVSVKRNEGSAERTASVFVSLTDGTATEIAVIQSGFSSGGVEDGESHQDESGSYTLDSQTVMISSRLADEIQDFDPTACTFYAPKQVADSLKLATGSKIVISTPTEQFPEGLLAMVQEAEPDARGGYRIRYSQAHLLECFKELEVNGTDMDIASHVSKVVDANGNEIDFAQTRSVSTEKLNIVVPQIELDLPMGISVTPKMTVGLTMKTQVIIHDYTLSTLNFIVDADCQIGADISAECDYSSLTYTPEKKICSIYFAAFPVGPLVVTPSVDIYAFVQFDMSLKLVATVSYRRSFRSHIHYDEAAGLEISTKLYDEEPDAFQYSVGPKLEGGITYGLGIGPGISLYGGTVGTSVFLRPGINQSVSTSFNFLDPSVFTSERNALVFPYESVSPTYDCNFSLNAGASLYGIGFGYSASSPTAKWPMISKPVLPVLSDEIEVENDGEQATFKLYVEGQSLVYGPIAALLFNHDAPWDPSEYISLVFDYDKEKHEALAETDRVEIKASAMLSPGKNYDLDVNVNLMDNWFRIRSYQTNTAGVDARLSAAVRGILRDILASASGEWKGCNWDDKTVSVGDYKNVEIKKCSGGMLDIRIDIPEDWPMGSTLKITPHTTGLESMIYGWELHIDGSDRSFSKIDIDDPLIEDVYVCDHVDWFGLHSEVSGISIYSLPAHIKTLDLSRCYGLDSDISVNMGTYPKLKQIILDDCLNFKNFSISGPSDTSVPAVQAKGSTTFKNIWVSGLNMTGADFSGISSVANLDIRKCSGTCTFKTNADSLSLKGTFDEVVIAECNNLKYFDIYEFCSPILSITANPSLEYVKLYLRSSETPSWHIGALSVTDCPSLKNLQCWNTGISSLTLTGLPSLALLDCSNNQNLTGIMLPIFDEMFERGCTPVYDQRFYNYWDNSYQDRGYGFYYEGEPDRGYHRK